MKEAYVKSLKIIRTLKVKTEKEYNSLVKKYLILNVESLKYMSRTRDFKEIVNMAEEVE